MYYHWAWHSFAIASSSKSQKNTEYNVNYFLKPLFSVHLPRLSPIEIDKELFLHNDKASSHTANLTTSDLSKVIYKTRTNIKQTKGIH